MRLLGTADPLAPLNPELDWQPGDDSRVRVMILNVMLTEIDAVLESIRRVALPVAGYG